MKRTKLMKMREKSGWRIIDITFSIFSIIFHSDDTENYEVKLMVIIYLLNEIKKCVYNQSLFLTLLF